MSVVHVLVAVITYMAMITRSNADRVNPFDLTVSPPIFPPTVVGNTSTVNFTFTTQLPFITDLCPSIKVTFKTMYGGVFHEGRGTGPGKVCTFPVYFSPVEVGLSSVQATLQAGNTVVPFWGVVGQGEQK